MGILNAFLAFETPLFGALNANISYKSTTFELFKFKKCSMKRHKGKTPFWVFKRQKVVFLLPAFMKLTPDEFHYC